MGSFAPVVVCADVGSVAKGKFGWWSSDDHCGDRPSTLSGFVAEQLAARRPVALGFECPLFVPLVDDEARLTAARVGEGSRAWSAGAGCGALTTGLVQVAWTLRDLKARVADDVPAFLRWEEFVARGTGMLIWEAFVSGGSKGTSHVEDSRLGAEAFSASLPNPMSANAVECPSGAFSLAGAALLRAGWRSDVAVLEEACLVVKAGTNAL